MSTYTWADLGSTWERFGSSQWYYINESLTETVNVDLLNVAGSKGVGLALSESSVSVAVSAVMDSASRSGAAAPQSVSVSATASGIKTVVGAGDAVSVTIQAVSYGYKTASYAIQSVVSIHIIDASGTALKPPADVQLEEVDLGVVRVIWDAVSGAQHGYDVMRDGEVIARDIMVTEYVDESAPNGLREYRVGTVVMEEVV